jgi:hypothetical protein
MKKIICLLAIAFAFSCKKDGSGSGQHKLLLSKVYFNDLLQSEYIYSTEGRLIRMNYFTIGGGVSSLSTYRIYNYNGDGTIKEVLHYNNSHIATIKKVYTYNAQGKVSRIDEASDYTLSSDFDDTDYYFVYDYDAKGQLTKVTSREPNFTLRYYENFSYDDDGNLVYYESRYNDDGQVVLKEKLDIVHGDKKIPEHWQKMLIEPTDFSLYEMFIASKKYTSYWSPPASIYEYVYKSRVYNNEGYLTSQVYETTSSGSIYNNKYTYEYVQQ